MLAGMVDTLMLSSVGDKAVGAVGTANTYIGIFIIMFSVISSGMIAVMTQYIGAGRVGIAYQARKLGLVFNAVLGILLSVFLFLCAGTVLETVGVAELLMDYAKTYLKIVGGSCILNALIPIFSSYLRAFGYTRQPLVAIIVENILNLILNAVFLFIFEWGVMGVAVATVISRVLNLVIVIYFAHRLVHAGDEPERLANRTVLGQIVRIGLPSALETALYNVAMTLVIRFLNQIQYCFFVLLSILELQYKELVVIQKAFYNKFKQDLGSSDAINEYIEVLLRQFESSTPDESSFQSIASRFGIRVNDVSPQVAICKIREYYIVSVYQVFEEFLNQMHAFLKEYGVYKENKDSSTSMLKHIHVNLVGMKKTSENAYLYYLICDYYRLIRNLCAHTDNINKAQNVYQKLFERKDEINVLFQKLQAPNRYDNINFDDFILYSRAAKKLAEIYISNIEYDIDKIITNFDIGHLRVYRNNPKRLSKALETEIKFNFCMKPETVKMVVDMIVKMI